MPVNNLCLQEISMNHLQQPTPAPATANDKFPGSWKLAQGRALTLRARSGGVLRIAQGAVWITFNNAQRDDSERGGDHFLGTGDVLHLLPGQTLVMESLKAGAHSSAYFSWDPLPASAGATVAHSRPVLARSVATRGQVLQLLRDLRAALGLALVASARLVAGLALASGSQQKCVKHRSATLGR